MKPTSMWTTYVHLQARGMWCLRGQMCIRDRIADVAETGVDEVEAIIKKKEPAMA